MAKLVYSTITSLDGYINDERGNFDWSEPDAEVFKFVGELERDIGTYLYGRRIYETMVYWETFVGSDDETYLEDFAEIWRAASKIVFSRTLKDVSSVRTRVEREFDATMVRQMKRESALDLSVSGANLAGQAIEAGLVDEMHLFVTPVTVGGGTRAHAEHLRSNLELLDVHHFDSGVVHLHYAYRDRTKSDHIFNAAG
jgi:dihydrofolate reductase